MSIEKGGVQVALPRTLDNRFRYAPADYSWQSGSIFNNVSDETVRVTITSQIADTQLDIEATTSVVVCDAVAVDADQTGVTLVECQGSSAVGVNFEGACVNDDTCDFTDDARSLDCNRTLLCVVNLSRCVFLLSI